MAARLLRSPSPLSLGDPLIAPSNWHHYGHPPRYQPQHQPQPQTQSVPRRRERPRLGRRRPPQLYARNPRRPQCSAESMPSPTDDEVPFPSLDQTTLHGFGRSHLSPDDAFVSPPRRLGERSRSRRRKRPWKKLMWVKQSYPDNYTDQATFLENLQRNPRLKPYDFWPLVADSTVILQHVCSVIIFAVCFVGIFQERVSPVAVTSWSSFATFVGWILWERWLSEIEDPDDPSLGVAATVTGRAGRTGSMRRPGRAGSIRRPPPFRIESAPSTAGPSAVPSAASSTTNLHAHTTIQRAQSASTTSLASGLAHTPRASQEHLPELPPPFLAEENRSRQRVETIKSAILIYCTLLGLSPILKSLTRSTSSDSIWAMSFWLLAINIFFFDYSGGVGAKFPASLSTNAALMASTVLASRLPSTKQVFSLTLFSIEVFGLFPVFRRYVRHRSWRFHVLSAILLVLGAGLGVGLMVGDNKATDGWSWKSGFVGMTVGVLIAVLATGGCSWWLIGLQKYKNEIRGPWDPARPIIMNRPRWDDDS
ncbi:phosphatidylinositol glycan class C [Fusarium albosuccineum]|uniref:Phosphatidylinositol glycan class C n=1 Tax=Fusarium albosuccineum TaxID=1237068 RepID=A0A8H4KYG9_9HYPO|nr:phosphatidylinositol glycan class C [Fusarium albosuccineum]